MLFENFPPGVCRNVEPLLQASPGCFRISAIPFEPGMLPEATLRSQSIVGGSDLVINTIFQRHLLYSDSSWSR